MNEKPTAPVIVNPQGQPARTATDTNCPRCGAGEEKRVPANGFGIRRPACGQCGYLWADDIFVEKERA